MIIKRRHAFLIVQVSWREIGKTFCDQCQQMLLSIKKGFNVECSSSSFESAIFAAAADDGEGRGRLRRGRRGAGHQRGVQDLEEEHPLPL